LETNINSRLILFIFCKKVHIVALVLGYLLFVAKALKQGGKIMTKVNIVGVVVLLLIFAMPAFMSGPNPVGSVALADSSVTESAGGSCSGCSGWVWAHVKEAWRYVWGSEERIFTYWLESKPSYAYVNTGDARHHMFIAGAASGHWVGTNWTSSSSFTNVRLWYY
jgi:hypothetical protein